MPRSTETKDIAKEEKIQNKAEETKTSDSYEAEKIIKAAEVKANEILSAAEKKIQEMFDNAMQNTPTVQNVTIQQPEEKIPELPEYIKKMQEDLKKDTTVKLFNDGDKYTNDVFVAVNGKHRYQIQRGPEIKVPAFIAEIEKTSMKQDVKTNKMMKEEEERSKRRFRELYG